LFISAVSYSLRKPDFNTVRLRNFCVEAGRGRREAGEAGGEKNKIFILAKSVETLAR
jgi:hypothetical protein